MDWKKINIPKIIELARKIEKDSICLDTRVNFIYCDGEEELTISYRKLDEPERKNYGRQNK